MEVVFVMSDRPRFSGLQFESFTYPFLDFGCRTDPNRLVDSYLYPGAKNVANASLGRGLRGLYVHIPFCETICNFCPFIKSVGTRERIERYVEALLAELSILAGSPLLQTWELDAIYFGGGTPSLLELGQVERLMHRIRSCFRVSPAAEITFEFEPKSTGEELVRGLVGLGINRASFGTQTLDPVLRERANLTASIDEVHAAIGLLNEHIPNNNMDMIVGFPGQDTSSAVADVARAAASGVGSISLYPMDYVMTHPDLLDKIRRGVLPAPAPAAERLQAFHECREVLRDVFVEQNMYCFGSESSPACKYMFSILYGGYHDQCVGVGCGGYSCLQGLTYQNVPQEAAYVDAVLRDGRLPVHVAFAVQAYEKGLVYFPKRMSSSLAELDELDLRETYWDRIERLAEDGLVAVGEDMLTLTETGKQHYSSLMYEFFSEPQRRLFRKICRRLEQDLGGWSDDPAKIVRAPKVRSFGGFTSMTSRRSRSPRV